MLSKTKAIYNQGEMIIKMSQKPDYIDSQITNNLVNTKNIAPKFSKHNNG